VALIWIAFATLAFASLKPIWGQPGWPQNHEFNSFVQRTQIYAAHYRFHDFLPIWSSIDNKGFGSPQPLLYHRLFYAVAGAFAIITVSIKPALILAIVVFLLIGAWGIYFVMRALGVSRLASTIAGLSLIAANYTVTDWLVRGAVAELSGYMLVSWTMLYFLRSVQEERIRPGLGVILGLAFLAHSVLAYYLGLFYAAILFILIAARQVGFKIALVKSGLVALVFFLAIVLPFLIPMKIMGSAYDISRQLTATYHPAHQFQPLVDYFWRHWLFGQVWSDITVQIDLPITLLVMMGLFAAFCYRRDEPNRRKFRPRIFQPVLPFALLLIITLFLQSRFSAEFYRWVPGAAYIQFPWRLLAVITPTAIVLGLYLVDKLVPSLPARIVIVVFGLSMIVSSGAFAHIYYGSLNKFDPPLAPLTLSVYGEFIPKNVPDPPYTLQQVLSSAKASGCSIADGPPKTEVKRTEFHIDCRRATRIALPIYASTAHQLRIQSAAGPQPAVSCAPAPAQFPALCGVSLPAGKSVVNVRFPTYFTFLRSLLAPLPTQVSPAR